MSRTLEPRTIETLWRMESPRLIAALARLLRDLGLAEDFAHDALVTALERWPRDGLPDNPGAWLMTTARRRAIDHLRRARRFEAKEDQVAHEIVTSRAEDDPDTALDHDI